MVVYQVSVKICCEWLEDYANKESVSARQLYHQLRDAVSAENSGLMPWHSVFQTHLRLFFLQLMELYSGPLAFSRFRVLVFR